MVQNQIAAMLCVAMVAFLVLSIAAGIILSTCEDIQRSREARGKGTK